MPSPIYSVYTVKACKGEKTVYYTGISTDVVARIAKHRAGTGAKCLRGATVIELVFVCRGLTKSEALRVEYGLKRVSAKRKRAMEYFDFGETVSAILAKP